MVGLTKMVSSVPSYEGKRIMHLTCEMLGTYCDLTLITHQVQLSKRNVRLTKYSFDMNIQTGQQIKNRPRAPVDAHCWAGIGRLQYNTYLGSNSGNVTRVSQVRERRGEEVRGGRGRNCRKDTAGWHVPQDDKFRYLLRRYEGNIYMDIILNKRYLLFYLVPSFVLRRYYFCSFGAADLKIHDLQNNGIILNSYRQPRFEVYFFPAFFN